MNNRRLAWLLALCACSFTLGCAGSPPPRQTVYAPPPPPPAPAPRPIVRATRTVEEWVKLEHRITFQANRAVLTPEGEAALARLADDLRDRHDVVEIRVDGHVNSGRQSPRGQELSDERARVVRDRLIAMGFDAAMFTIEGRGATELVDPDVHRGEQNRRVELSALVRRTVSESDAG